MCSRQVLGDPFPSGIAFAQALKNALKAEQTSREGEGVPLLLPCFIPAHPSRLAQCPHNPPTPYG